MAACCRRLLEQLEAQGLRFWSIPGLKDLKECQARYKESKVLDFKGTTGGFVGCRMPQDHVCNFQRLSRHPTPYTYQQPCSGRRCDLVSI